MPRELHATIFQRERRRLAGLAYRMTDSVAETEDILQDAWLRFSRQELADIACVSRWLSAMVTRLCIDHLRSARNGAKAMSAPGCPIRW